MKQLQRTSRSNPEPKRKTNQYPGGTLPTDQAIDHDPFKQTLDRLRTDGENALLASFTNALNGIQYTNEISCLRGQLRKAIIKLAQQMAASQDLAMLPTERAARRARAAADFKALLDAHVIVTEHQNGQTVWRFRSRTRE